MSVSVVTVVGNPKPDSRTRALAEAAACEATYTGLRKLFCDRIPAGRLAGIVAVPVMTAASADHRLAAEVHLRPLPAELGAVQSVPVLFATETELDDIDAVVAAWSDTVSWRHVFGS